MRRFPVSLILGTFAVLAAAPAVQAADRTAPMPFRECLAIIAEAAEETGQKPVDLASAGDIRTVRIDAADGYVTVSCNKADNTMTLTKTGRTAALAAR